MFYIFQVRYMDGQMDGWRGGWIDTAVESFACGKEHCRQETKSSAFHASISLSKLNHHPPVPQAHTVGFCNPKRISRRDA